MQPGWTALIRRSVGAPWDPATVAVIALLALVAGLWLGAASGPTARADAEAVDTRAVDAPLAAVRERWTAEFDALRTTARRIALDDRTWEFVRRPNFPYVDDYFGPKAIAALAVDTVLIVDSRSRPIFWRRPNDPDHRGFADAEALLAQLPLLGAPAARAARGEPVVEGIAQVGGAPSLVTVLAIEPSEAGGEPRGFLVFGRALDGAVSRRVLEGLPPGLDVMPATDPLLPADVRLRLDRTLTPVVVADEQRIRGYLPLVDVQGRLVRVYAAAAPRPATVAAAPVVQRRSWTPATGATLVLLLAAAAGLWWTLAPARRARGSEQEEVERLARVLASESRGADIPAEARTPPPGAPETVVAETLVQLGASADAPPVPPWLAHERRDAPVAERDTAAEARTAEVAEATRDEEWMIGTPDEVLVGERATEVARTLDERSAVVRTETVAATESAAAAESATATATATGTVTATATAIAAPVEIATPIEIVTEAALEAEPVPELRSSPVFADDEDASAVVADVRFEPATSTNADPCETTGTFTTEELAPILASARPPAAFAEPTSAVVRRLLDEGRLRVCYQPQIATATGEIVGVEALLNWQDDAAVLKSARELFGADTSADAFADATEFVLRRACADRGAWLRQFGRSLPVSVNVGLAELRDPGFVDRVLRAVADAALPPGFLEIEVPEIAVARPGTPEAHSLDRAYRAGIGIAIGGFVAADAPLRALTQVPVSKLKIDRSLVSLLPDDTHARTVVDAILAVGRTLGVQVCAEGVETESQALWLERRHCPLVQGYHYARPMDADRFAARLRGSGVDTVRLPLMDVEQLEAHAREAGVV